MSNPNAFNTISGDRKKNIIKAIKVLASVNYALLTSQVLAYEVNDNKEPEITQKVYIDIKIANYTEESIGLNRAATGSGRIIIGLYGKASPLSVKRFLETVDGDGETTPNFYNAQFSKIVDGNLLEIEKIRGVNKISLAGSEQYEYKGNVLPNYNPILETNTLTHSTAGLLTRKQLSPGPEFGITLKNATNLDGFHIIFGKIISGYDVLESIADLPQYTYSTKTGYVGKSKDSNSQLDNLADKWFESQKDFYINLGKGLGDDRAVDQRGKLLRRVTIKSFGREK